MHAHVYIVYNYFINLQFYTSLYIHRCVQNTLSMFKLSACLTIAICTYYRELLDTHRSALQVTLRLPCRAQEYLLAVLLS